MEPLLEFQQLWDSSAIFPDLARFLKDCEDLETAELVAIVRLDLEKRWERGEPRSISDYLGDFPQLMNEPDVAKGLQEAEAALRLRYAQNESVEGGKEQDLSGEEILISESGSCTSQLTEVVVNDSELDRLCGRFEAEFEGEKVPSIESYLALVPEGHREKLFGWLLPVELWWLRKNATGVNREEYEVRFPQFVLGIRDAWEQFSRAESRHSTISPLPNSRASVELSQEAASVNSAEPLVFGNYQVLKKLGSGAFGSVYKAQHAITKNIVAIKMLLPRWADDPQCGQAMREQFAAEAQTMLEFDHPNIVRVISLDDQADPPYFVQEFIDGQTLRDRLKLGSPTLAETLQYAIQIADALAHMHVREKWHRDLKPENILLDITNNVCVADFGLVLDNAQRWNLRGQTAGTRPYMAPEQVRGRTHLLNARCDLWAFGVVLYELLVGRRPFSGEGEQLVTEILERTPPAPRELNRLIPRRINRLCMQCLAKRDADRPDAAADIADDLREELEKLTSEFETSDGVSGSGNGAAKPVAVSTTVSISGEANSDTDSGSADSAKSDAPPAEYPIPTLRKFTAEQAAMYLRLMPRSYNNLDELPELIAYWKQRIEERDPLKTFRVGVLVGVSGCGKSSLLEAGLVPQLADHVIPIFMEASDTDTEQRILVRLRRAFPDADPQGEWNLANWMFRLRSSNLLSDGRKVVVILDQFEQWLNAHGGEPTNELLEALDQCDGQRLQTVVCVREGFHATLMRFVDSLEIVLDADANYATSHRFKLDHARYVLTQFGRGLKRVDDPITEAQQAFIDATVDGLAESDRGVVCVRLVVLALVMQDRPWTVAELESLGGLDGIGSQFLTDCFEGRTASEQYRRYLPAVMRVLAELLPDEGLEIKDVRSYDQLLAASELDRLQFDDLLNILNRKLFLLTVVEADTGASVQHSRNSLSTTQNYQLTHDFLVPSIREWLAVKERQTRAGRARLKLAQRTAAWRAKRERSQLPTPLETATIYWRTDSGRWTQDQQEMMRAAVKHHSTLWGTVAVLMLVVGIMLRTRQSQRELDLQRQQVHVATESLQNNLGPSIPVNIRELKKLPEPLVLGELVERFSTDNSRHKLALAIALSAYGRPELEYLVSRIDDLALVGTANFVNALSVDREQALVKIKAAADECRSDALWRRKAKLAIAALALGEAGIASDMCQYGNRPDPGQRTIFIHEFPQWEWHLANRTLDLAQVAGQVAETQDSGLRSGLCLAVGSIPKDRVQDVNPNAVDSWSQLASRWFAEHRDTSTHSAARWLLQRWEIPLPEVPDHDQIRSDRDWFVNSAGMTMLRIKPPDSQPKRKIKLGDPLERFRQQLGELQELPPEKMTTSQRLSRAIAHFKTANYSAALAEFESLNEDSPGLIIGHIMSYQILSLARLGRHDEAAAAFESERETLDANSDLYSASQLASLRGDPSSSLELLTKAARDETLAEGELYDAACAAALCASIVTEKDRDNFLSFKRLALALLSASIKAGYSDGQYLSEDPDFAGLHHEPEFLTLVGKIYKVDDDPALPRTEYWIANCEVTRGQFEAFVQDTDYSHQKPAEWQGVYEKVSPSVDHPAQNISWYDAVMYCNWLSRREGKTPAYRRTGNKEKGGFRNEEFDQWVRVASADGYRLPSEVEWEFAARAGSDTDWSSGADELLLADYCQMYPSRQTSEVCVKLPNAWGTHDMYGNVEEWCHDVGTIISIVALRVVRGGFWIRTASECRSASRDAHAMADRNANIGFRLAFSPSTSQAPSLKENADGALDKGTEEVAEQRMEMP